MQLTKHILTPLSLAILASLFLWGGMSNAAFSQTYDVSDWSDWYGDEDAFYGDYDDLNDYFHSESIYNLNNDLNDFYYDPGYNSPYFPGNYELFDNYTAFGPNLGPNRYGGDRYFGPHLRYGGGYSLYEYPYGYNNYYFDAEGLGADYFTEDWYDDNSTFDDWY